MGLQWSGTPGVLYQVENAVNFGAPWAPVDAPTTSFVSTNLACDPTRMYRVALFTNTPAYLANYSLNSRDTTPPGVPAPLILSATSASQVDLFWTPVLDVGTFDSGQGQTYTSGLDRYLIYRDGIYLKSEPANITHSTDRSVTSGVQYTYSVAAIDKAGNVSQKISDSVSACSISLQPVSTITGSGATSGSFFVNASGCSWSASVPTESSWIQLQGPASGNGSATINYFVTANPGLTDRVGTIQVQNRTYTITQLAGSCTYSLNPASFTHGNAGGLATFNVSASSACNWTATTTDGWIHTSTSGSGDGTVAYIVDSNNGPARSGTVSVAGQSFTVNQDGAACTYVLNPTSISSGSASFLGSFTVTTPGGCGWLPEVTNSWIHTTIVAGGVNYSVDANSAPESRGGNGQYCRSALYYYSGWCWL